MADETVLICPQGAETAPISHGATGYEAWHHHASGHWLVRVPTWTVPHFRSSGAGFVVAPDELQAEQPP
jgi:hypothetical protein